MLASRGASRHARRRPTMRDALSRRNWGRGAGTVPDTVRAVPDDHPGRSRRAGPLATCQEAIRAGHYGRPPRPVRPGISARGSGRGDRRRPRRRHRTDAPCRSSGSGPGRPRPSGRIGPGGGDPARRGGGRAAAREGIDGGDSSHRGDSRHDARLLQGGPAPVVRRRSRPALRCGSGGKTPGEDGRTPEPAPAAEVRQPGSLVMSLLVCCRLVM